MSRFSELRNYNTTFCVLCLIWSLSLTLLVQGQTTSNYDGKTPSGLAPGAPAGSYPLSGFDNLNLYSGKLNFRLPLWQLGGARHGGLHRTHHH